MKIPELICKPPAQTQFCIQSWNIKQYAVNHNVEVNFLEHRLTYPFPFSLTNSQPPLLNTSPALTVSFLLFPIADIILLSSVLGSLSFSGFTFNTYYSFVTAETLLKNLK